MDKNGKLGYVRIYHEHESGQQFGLSESYYFYNEQNAEKYWNKIKELINNN